MRRNDEGGVEHDDRAGRTRAARVWAVGLGVWLGAWGAIPAATRAQEPRSGEIAQPGATRIKLTFQPGPLEASVPDLYRLEGATFTSEMELRREFEDFRVWTVRFPSPIESPDEANNTVHAEYYEPKGGEASSKRPGVVVLHILGADFALSRFMCIRLAQHGVAALFMKLPYYGERQGNGPGHGERAGGRLLSVDIERSVRAMRQGICDVRRSVFWLKNRPEVDPARLGVAGISLGGIVSSIAASVDPEISEAALLLAGGNLSEILWTMPEGRRYRDQWIAEGKTREDLEVLTKPFDPLRFGDRLRGKRVLMIAGNVDDTVPPRCTLELWKVAGRPPIRWLDCGHYSAASYLLPEMRVVCEFFANPDAPIPTSNSGAGVEDPAEEPGKGKEGHP